jgi:hypothetical protein
MKNILQECIDIIKDLVGNDYLYFESAIEIKLTPHTYPFYAWGVCVSPADALYVMDSNQDWHEVILNEGNASLVVGSLYQRLKMMRTHYAKAS